MERTVTRQLFAVALMAGAGAGLAQPVDDAVTRATRETFMAHSVHHDPSYFAEDATFTDMTNPSQPLVGRDAIGAMLATFFSGAFADGGYRTENLLIEGNRVLLEFTYLGTHTGQFGELPPTGRRVELPMMSVYHVEDGLIRWARLYYDSASLLRQLGVIE